MPREHPYDEAASEIVRWLDEAPSYYAEAMKGGHDAPFSAKTTEQQKLEYFKRQVFQTQLDGSPDYSKPNTQGRQMLIDRLGINGYTQVMAAVMPRRVVAYNAMNLPVEQAPEPPAPFEVAKPELDIPVSPAEPDLPETPGSY